MILNVILHYVFLSEYKKTHTHTYTHPGTHVSVRTSINMICSSGSHPNAKIETPDPYPNLHPRAILT